MKNGIVIDGVAHELVEAEGCVCSGCSLEIKCISGNTHDVGDLCKFFEEWGELDKKFKFGVRFKKIETK